VPPGIDADTLRLIGQDYLQMAADLDAHAGAAAVVLVTPLSTAIGQP
jgi:hypothetical protein